MASNPFHVDWENMLTVISYAKSLGKGQIVFKSPRRCNYNITHAEHEQRVIDDGCKIIYRT